MNTLTEIIDIYTDEAMNHKSPNTIKMQIHQLEYWKLKIGHLNIKECTARDIMIARDELVKTHREKATANRYIQALSPVFTYAANVLEIIDKNPIRQIKRYREQPRLRFLDKAEIDRLLSAAIQYTESPYLYALILLALTTGMRKGEILTLRWTDIQGDKIILRNTKNGDMRILNIADKVLETLRELTAITPTTTYIFEGKTGKPFFLAISVWKKLIKKAGLKNFRFHDLRHTAASHLAMNGESTITIAEILGHKTLAMVKRYTHLSNETQRQALAKLAELCK